MSLQALYEEALGSHKRGDLAAAENLYRQVLAAAPASFAAQSHEMCALPLTNHDTKRKFRP